MDNQQGFNLIAQLDENLFEIFWEGYGKVINLNKDFIKKVFLAVDIKYKSVISSSDDKVDALLKNVSVFDTINYICAEHKFHLNLINKERVNELENDEKYFNQLVGICYDKLIVNEFKNVDSRAVISKYSVEISVLEMFVNRLFVVLMSLKLDPNSKKQKLLTDIYAKCFTLVKSTLNQLCDGLETEGMSSWRTFHELESVLCVINKGDEKVAEAYFRHLTYGAYSRGEVKDESTIEAIQKSIEKDMLALEVKKANREKFINYGWIHWAYKEYNGEEVKMNFLGGLEKVADLTQFKKFYELSSDVTHSTPLLVYANKTNLTTTTLKITFESFFILEEMFMKWIVNELKMDIESSPALKDYYNFKRAYKQKLELVYQMINAKYAHIAN